MNPNAHPRRRTFRLLRIGTFLLALLWSRIPAASLPENPVMPDRPSTKTAESSLSPEAANTGDTVSELLARAMQCTARGDTQQALALYRRVASLDPPEGIPALGRFLELTRAEAERTHFIKQLETEPSDLDPLTRARGLLGVGEKARALSVLRTSMAIRRGEQVKGTLFLAELLRRDGKTTDSERILYEALRSTGAPDNRTRLFKALFGGDRLPFADSPASLTLALDLGVPAWRPTRAELVSLLDPPIMNLQSSPGYFARRDAIRRWAPKRGPATAWFVSRLLAREGRYTDALAFLLPREKRQTDSALWPLLAEETAELYRNAGHDDEARSLLETLAKKEQGSRASVGYLEAAGLAFARKDVDKTLVLLAKVDPGTLPPDQLHSYYNTSLSAAARAGKISLLLDLYAKAAPHASPDDFNFYHTVIFQNMQETATHEALDKAIRDKLRNDPAASPFLWQFDAVTCEHLRSKPNQLEALYHFVQARPKDLHALDLLARTALPVALNVIKAPQNMLAVPHEEILKLTEITEKSLVALIRARPYDPTYYGALISLEKALGKNDAALAVPDIVAKDTRNPRILGVAGYALAINGFPEKALGYYDRALAISPDDIFIRMNRTACLTRVGRWDEAARIYRQFLEKGQNGHKYDPGELINRIWQIAVHQHQEAKEIDYFRSLDGKIQGDWTDEALHDVAALMAKEKKLDVASEFYEKIRKRAKSDEERAAIDGDIGTLFLKAGKYEKAGKVFREAAERYSAAPEKSVAFRGMEAEALAGLGKTDKAIEQILRLVRDYPTLPAAYNGLYRAASIAEKAGQRQRAVSLYREFLKTPTTQFERRHEAEAKIKELESDSRTEAEAPSESAPGNSPRTVR